MQGATVIHIRKVRRNAFQRYYRFLQQYSIFKERYTVNFTGDDPSKIDVKRDDRNQFTSAMSNRYVGKKIIFFLFELILFIYLFAFLYIYLGFNFYLNI